MATTSVKRGPQRAQRKSGTRQASNGSKPTKASTRPTDLPEKAHKPEPAAKSGRPEKADKPEPAAKSGRPGKARKPKPAREAARSKSSKKKDSPIGGLEGAAEKAQELAGPGEALIKAAAPGGSATMRKLALKVAKSLAERAVSRGTEALSLPTGGLSQTREKLLESVATTTEPSSRRRPPIQCCVEAGVPVDVAWDELMALGWLPEGVDRVLDVKRKGKSKLAGHLDGANGSKWWAEILDERENHSFAWQSHGASDCAGLITLHSLGDTLTRIEVSLDVVPTSLAQAAALTTRLADRRTQADLKRFKAHLELINPDLYADDDTQAG